MADSKPTGQIVQPEPALRQPIITKSSNPELKPEEHPLKTDPAVLQPTPVGRRAPGSVSSLVLGILSIPLALVVGGIVFLIVAFGDDEALVFHFGSLVAGIISIAMAVKAKRTAQSSAEHHYYCGMATAGMVCAIVGITIFLFFLFAILSEI